MSAVSLECCQPMTRKHYERRAGVRLEDDDDQRSTR